MAAVTLKNVPEDLLLKLRDAAESEHRSLNQHALHLLKQGVSRDGALTRPDVTAARTAAWQELCGAWESNTTTKKDVARIYRRRSAGRKVNL